MKQLKIASAIFGIGLFFSTTAYAEEGHESASNSHELSNSPEQIEQKVSHEQKQKTAPKAPHLQLAQSRVTS